MLNAADLPDDIAALKAMLIAATAREGRKDERIERLERLVAAFRQAAFGRKSEKTDPDQFDLALEDLETAIAAVQAEDEADAPAGKRLSRPRATNRGSLPGHLPRIEEVIEPASLICACGGCLHCIGEDVSERLDVIPAQLRVIVTRRPKYACRACTDGVVQAPTPARLIQAGLPTEATIAHVLVCKYADHLPLYRQAQIMSRQGIDLDRSTLADWVGRSRGVVALVGDSHAMSVALAMEEVVHGANSGFVLMANTGCPPLIGVDSPSTNPACARILTQIFETIEVSDDIQAVVLVSRWSFWAEGGSEYSGRIGMIDRFSPDTVDGHEIFAAGLHRTLESLKKSGKNALLVGPVPEHNVHVAKKYNLGKVFGRPLAFGRDAQEHTTRTSFISELFASSQISGRVLYLDPSPAFCDQITCWASTDTSPLYGDDNHLSLAGAARLAPLFQDALSNMVVSPREVSGTTGVRIRDSEASSR